MVMDIKLGDVVRLKKKHPCGSDEWQVTRLGADISVKCLKCQRYVVLERSIFERRVISRESGKEMAADKEKELETKLADLKSRWPPHSVPISMWQELEELEEELEKIRKEKAKDR
jgi:hypothetical protein